MVDVSEKRINHPFSEFSVKLNSMTTTVEIVAGENKHLAQKGASYLLHLVDIYNRFDSNSEFFKLHQHKDKWTYVSDELFHLLAISQEMQVLTDNQFRIDFESLQSGPYKAKGFELDFENKRVKLYPQTQLNAGGIAKGVIVDLTVQFLIKNGAENCMVNAGGDCRVSGNYLCKVGLFNPLDTKLAFGHVSIRNGAVVTSGSYARSIQKNSEKSTHFFDTDQNKYQEQSPFASMTVVGTEAAKSEVFAKILLMGKFCHIPKKHKAIGVTFPDYQVKSFTY